MASESTAGRNVFDEHRQGARSRMPAGVRERYRL